MSANARGEGPAPKVSPAPVKDVDWAASPVKKSGSGFRSQMDGSQVVAPSSVTPVRGPFNLAEDARNATGTQVFAVEDRAVVVVGGVVQAFSVDGRRVWSRTLGQGATTMRGVGGASSDVIVVVSIGRDGRLVRFLDPADGSDLGKVELVGMETAVAVDGDRVVVADVTGAGTQVSGYTRDGKRVWSQQLPQQLGYAVTVPDGVLVYGRDSEATGRVALVDPASGQVSSSFDVAPTVVDMRVAVEKGGWWVPTTDGGWARSGRGKGVNAPVAGDGVRTYQLVGSGWRSGSVKVDAISPGGLPVTGTGASTVWSEPVLGFPFTVTDAGSGKSVLSLAGPGGRRVFQDAVVVDGGVMALSCVPEDGIACGDYDLVSWRPSGKHLD